MFEVIAIPSQRVQSQHCLDELSAPKYATFLVGLRYPEVRFGKGGLHGARRQSRV